MKKLLTLILVISLCFTIAIPAYAAVRDLPSPSFTVFKSSYLYKAQDSSSGHHLTLSPGAIVKVQFDLASAKWARGRYGGIDGYVLSDCLRFTRREIGVALFSDAILQSGDTGEAVLNFQTALVKHGFSSGTPTGSYGSGTVAAVKNLQRKHGLTQDGIVGEHTKDVMLLELGLFEGNGY